MSYEYQTFRIYIEYTSDNILSTMISMSDEEFLNLIDENDIHGNNFFHFVSREAPKDFMKLIIEKFEKVASRERIRDILSTLTQSSHNILQLAATHNECPEAHRILWNFIRKYFNVLEILEMLKHRSINGNNVLHFSISCNKLEVVETIFKEISNTCGDKELFDYLKSVNNNCENILHLVMATNNEKKLIFLWNTLKKTEQIKELLLQQMSLKGKLNTLQFASFSERVELHMTLWKLLLNTFSEREELLNLMLQKNEDGNNFFYLTVAYNKPNVIEFTIKKAKEIFNDAQYKEILRTKGKMERNLLQVAIVGSKDLETHQYLWKEFKDTYKPNILEKLNIFARSTRSKNSEIFFNILTEIDSQKCNIFHAAACFTTGEIMKFIIKELEEVASRKEIKDFLSQLANMNRNILQIAVQNKSLTAHQQLWKIIHKYFDRSEIIEMINQSDESGYNVLISTAEVSMIDIAELTWNEITGILRSAELTELLKSTRNDNENIIFALMKSNDEKKLNFFWKRIENHLMLPYGLPSNLKQMRSNELLKELLTHKTEETKSSLLLLAARSERLEFHKTLWDLMLKTFENREELKELILHQNDKGKMFIHALIFLGKLEIIEYILTKFSSSFNKNQFKEILKSKEGIIGLNLYQVALMQQKDIEIHQFLWKLTSEYLDSSEILEIVVHKDDNGNNLFGYVAQSSKSIAEFTWNQIKSVYAKFENKGLKEILTNINNDGESFLYSLGKEENENKFKFFCLELENHLSNQELKDFLWIKNHANDQSVLHYAAHSSKMEFYNDLWELLLKNFTDREELKNLILDKTKKGHNFLTILLMETDSKIVELNFQKLKENFNEMQQKEIFSTKMETKNLMQIALVTSEELKTHQILWETTKNICKSDKEFLEILSNTENANSNIFHLAVLGTTEEILKFMIEELEKFASRQEIKEMLGSLGHLDANLLQTAATLKNECFKFHKFLWKVIRKYFETSEIVKMIKNIDGNGRNLLLNVVLYGTKNTKKQYWEEIKNVLGTDIFEYLETTDENGENIIRHLVHKQDVEVLKYFLEEILKCSNLPNTSNSSPDSKRKLELTSNLLRNLIHQKSKVSDKNILQLLVYSKDVEFHEAFWEFLLKSVKNQDELNDLITQKSNDGMNCIQYFVAFNKIEIIELAVEKIRSVLSNSQFKEVLTSSENKYNLNLLQIASNAMDDVDGYNQFWNIVCKYTDSSTMLEMLNHNDHEENNLLLFVLKTNSNKITIPTWNKIKAIAKEIVNFDMKEYLSKVNRNNVNALHLISKKENSDELIFFWTEFGKCFKSQNEFKKFIRQTRPETEQTILHLVSECKKIEFQQTFWNLLLQTYDNQEELMKLLMQRDINENTFLLSSVTDNNIHMITFMLNKLKENLNDEQYAELLNAKGGYNRNIIQRAAVGLKDLEKFEILHRNVQDISQSTEGFLKYFTDIDENGSNLVHITASTSSSEIFEYTMKSLERIANRIEIRKILSSKGIKHTNLLQIATLANSSFDSHKILWKVVKKYFNSSELFEMINYSDDNFGCNTCFYAMSSPKSSEDIRRLIWNEIKNIFDKFGEDSAEKMLEYLKQINKSEQSILTYLIQENYETLDFHLTICENYFITKNSPNHFKDLITQKALSSSETILHAVAKNDEIECHKIIWKFLLNSFENREELKNFILEKDENGDNFFPNLLLYCQSNVIQFTFEKIKEIFSDKHYQEIIKSKIQTGKNLLQVAVCISEDLKVHQILWLIIKNSCKSNDEFLEFLESTDDDYSNVFHDAASFGSNESYFEFVTEELTKITTTDKIKQILATSGSKNRNLLQMTSYNKKIGCNQNLWRIIIKYFDCIEILNMISHTDEYGLNLLNYIAKYDLNSINDFTIEEISKLLSSNKSFNDISSNMSDLWNNCKSIIKSNPQSTDTRSKLTSIWSELTKNIKVYDSLEIHNKILNNQILLDKDLQDPLKPSLKNYKTLHEMIYCEQIEVQKASWKIVFDSFVNKNEIKDLLLLEDVDGNNFIHSLVLNENPELIELMFQIMQENLTTEQFHQILRSKSQYGGNLLYTAALYSKNTKVHQILWKVFREAFSIDFLEVIKETDNADDNVLHIAVRFATKEIVDFIFDQLEELTSPDEFKGILKTNGRSLRNLLQMIAEECFLPEVHLSIWNIFCKYFDSREIVDLIKHCDEDGDRLIHNVVAWNTVEIVELTWNQIKRFIISRNDQIEYLNTTGYKEQNLKQRSEDNEEETSEVKLWVDQVLSEYEIVFDSE